MLPTYHLPQTTRQVPPAYSVCRMPNVAAFSPGVWNGKPHDAEFIKKLHENFQKFSSGPNPYYQPYVSLNHKDELRSGFVSQSRVNGQTLHLDADGIPEPIGAMRNAGGFTQPSIEYFEPVWDERGNLIDGFRRPDGSIEPSPVLKCLTLLGADSPANKGLPNLPYAVFADAPHTHKCFGKRVRKFSNQQGATMDRTAILQALAAAGLDVSGVTDAVPDEFLKAVLDMVQKAQAAPVTPAAATTTDTTANAFADAAAGISGAPAVATAPAAAAAPNIPGLGTAQPSSVVLKFADNTPAGMLAGINAWATAMEARVRAEVTQQVATVTRQNQQQAHAAKFADAQKFVNDLAKPDDKGFVRIMPAQKAVLLAGLMKLDSLVVRKFADGKGTGSEYEEGKALHLATLPKIPFRKEQMPDPAPNAPGGKVNGVDPDRRTRMLAATPQGRAILAKEGKVVARA